LQQVTAPVDVFHGTQDIIVAPDAGRALAQRLPKATFHAIGPGGHLCFLTHWRELLATLAEGVGKEVN
jgi:3-oxoadipate enol-lactonase